MKGSPTHATGAQQSSARDRDALWVSEWWLPPASPEVEEGDAAVAVPRPVIGVEIPDRGLPQRLAGMGARR